METLFLSILFSSFDEEYQSSLCPWMICMVTYELTTLFLLPNRTNCACPLVSLSTLTRTLSCVLPYVFFTYWTYFFNILRKKISSNVVLLHTIYMEYHTPTKKSPLQRLRHKQRHGIYPMEYDMEMCMYRQNCSLKDYKHENEKVMGQACEYLSCTRHHTMPESQNKPPFTIFKHEDLRAQRK